METEPVYITHWEKLLDFNPHSWQQVGALIKHCGLAMPKKRGEDRSTTEARYLRRFSKKHEVFKWVLECRERKKMLSTYMWPLDAGGAVHTTYSWHPSTLRKSSRNVNLQNIPKRSDLAGSFRRMLVASPGHNLIEADSSAIEAVLVGYGAGSERYIRLAKAGIHGWLASHWLGCPIPLDLPDAELARRCKDMKRANPLIYEACKRGGIHGPNYLLTPHGTYDEYAELFPKGLKQVKELHELYFSLPPGQDVKRWQQATMERAHAQHYLDNHFGYRHYLYDVFSWDRKRDGWSMGTDAKRAVAFGPQSDASAIQTEILLVLAETPVAPWMRLIVHDSLILEVPEGQVGEAVALTQAAFTCSWPELGGLDIGCEVSMGRNLAPASSENPDGMRGV